MNTEMLNANEILHRFSRLTAGATETRPLPQVRLLLALLERPSAPMPSTLAAEWHLSRAAITKALRPLIEESLVAQTPRPDDRRSFTIALTPAGSEVARALASTYLRPLRQLRQGLGEADYRRLFALLASANDILTAAAQSPAP